MFSIAILLIFNLDVVFDSEAEDAGSSEAPPRSTTPCSSWEADHAKNNVLYKYLQTARDADCCGHLPSSMDSTECVSFFLLIVGSS